MREQASGSIFDPASEQSADISRNEGVSRPSRLQRMLRALRGPDPMAPLWTRHVHFYLTSGEAVLSPEAALHFPPGETTEDRLKIILGDDYKAPDD